MTVTSSNIIALSLKALSRARYSGGDISEIHSAIAACEAARRALETVPRLAITPDQVANTRSCMKACAKARSAVGRALPADTEDEILVLKAITGLWKVLEVDLKILASERLLADIEGAPFPRLNLIK